MAISRDKILKEAEKLVQKGKLDGAIRQYEKLLKANPNDVTIINRVGDLYGKVGQVDKAIELYERIAEFFVQDGFLKKAIAVLKKINRMAPQRLDIFERLAELYVELSLMGEAKTQYQILADWYSKHGDRENALRVQKKLAEVDPGNHVVQLRLADMLMEAGEHEEALQVFSQLVHVLLDRGKIDEAEKLVHHVLDLKPPKAGFMAPVCAELLESGKKGRAQDLVEMGLALSPDDPELKSLKVRLSVEGDNLDDLSLEAAESLLQSDPSNDEVRMVVGRKLISSGNGEQAREVLAPLIESGLKRGDLRAVQELSEELRRILPGDVNVLQWSLRAFELAGQRDKVLEIKADLADIFYSKGRPDAAQPLYMELADLDPENDIFRQRLLELSSRGFMPGTGAPEAGPSGGAAVPTPASPPALAFDPEERLGEARVFAKYGLADKAIRHLEELLRAYPQHHRARRELVRMLCEDGQLKRAKEIAAPLEEHYRSTSDEEGLAWLAEVLHSPVVMLSGEESQGAGASAGAAGPETANEEEEVLFLDLDGEGEALADWGLESAHGSEVQPGAGLSGGLETPEVLELDIDEDQPGSTGPGAATPGEAAARNGEPAPPAKAPESVLRPMSDLDASGILDAAGILAQGGPRDEARPLAELSGPAGGMEELDMSWVDEAIRRDSGAAAVNTWVPESDLESPVIEVPEPSVPGAPEAFDGGDGEAVELLDITGVVEGPKISDLERLDFFISEELFQDAARILEELEGRFPGDPELAERRLRLKERGVILMESSGPGAEPAEELFSEEELYVDLAGELEKELAAEEAMVEEATGRGKDEALLEEVFREFQKGVAEQLSEEDSDTHFNLGIAYKEMGLLPEAIGEFQVAAKNPIFHLEGCSMIAVCYMEQGLHEEAARWYEKALEANGLSKEAKMALYYDLGSALLAAGRDDDAYSALAEVAAIDPGYRDIGTLLQSVQRQRHAN